MLCLFVLFFWLLFVCFPVALFWDVSIFLLPAVWWTCSQNQMNCGDHSYIHPLNLKSWSYFILHFYLPHYKNTTVWSGISSLSGHRSCQCSSCSLRQTTMTRRNTTRVSETSPRCSHEWRQRLQSLWCENKENNKEDFLSRVTKHPPTLPHITYINILFTEQTQTHSFLLHSLHQG